MFLSAALTRLVIDPYREACSAETTIGRSFELKQPFLFTGFDDAPEPVRQALAVGLATEGCGYIGSKPLHTGLDAGGGAAGGEKPAWLQLVLPDSEGSREEADGLLFPMGRNHQPPRVERVRPDQVLGLVVRASDLVQAIPHALDQGHDLLLLDGSAGIEQPWVELRGEPDLTVMRDAIRLLRELGREEDIALVYFGGMRSGTDVAKTLAINCRAAVFGVTAGFVLGGSVDGDQMEFDIGTRGGPSVDEQSQAVENWIHATAQETGIIARCTGKTNVHNLEPEDMRSITLSSSEALGIPLASGSDRREGF